MSARPVADRPAALVLFVMGSVLGALFSLVRDPGALSFPAIVFTLVLLGLLKKLWDGEPAMWWLFVVASAGVLVAAAIAAFDDSAALAGMTAGVVSLGLLLSGQTRSWFGVRGGAPD